MGLPTRPYVDADALCKIGDNDVNSRRNSGELDGNTQKLNDLVNADMAKNKIEKPKLFVARAVFPEVLEKLGVYFELEANQEDRIFTESELIQRL